MFKKEDELLQTAKRIAIRYSYLFQVILLGVLFFLSNQYNTLVILKPIYLIDSSFSVSILFHKSMIILLHTQILVLLVSQAVFNRHLGGPTGPITSGSGGFRFMDERERLVCDKSITITFIYINIFLVIGTIIDIFVNKTLGLCLIIIILEFIIYMIIKSTIAHKLGWER